MKVLQNYSLDVEHVEMLNSLQEKAQLNSIQEKAQTSKSFLIREFIRYFTEKETEFLQFIKDGEIKRAEEK